MKLYFEHFSNKTKYLELQNLFLKDSIKNQEKLWHLPLSEPVDAFMMGIFVEIRDEDGTMKIQKRHFLNHVVYPGIDSLAYHYFENFKAYKHDKGIFGKESVQDYCESEIYLLKVHLQNIDKAIYLDDDIRGRVGTQLERSLQDVRKYVENPYPSSHPKLKFKWSKADVIYFFHMLRENKQIEYLTNVDYSKIIDEFMEFQNLKGFKAIDDSAKRLGDYTQASPKPANESIKRLMSVFNDSKYFK